LVCHENGHGCHNSISTDRTTWFACETGIDRDCQTGRQIGFVVDRTECIGLTNSSLTDCCQRMHSLTGGIPRHDMDGLLA
jgi:hypothetical protein